MAKVIVQFWGDRPKFCNNFDEMLLHDEARELIKQIEEYIATNPETEIKEYNSSKRYTTQWYYPFYKYEELQSQLKTQKERDKDKSGYVYLIGSENGFKIGKATNPEKRFYSIKTSSPVKIQLLHTIKSDDPKKLENELHDKFKPKLIQGEWFNLDSSEIDYIKGL